MNGWPLILLYAAGFVVVAFLVWRDERHDVDRLADPTPTERERIRDALDAEALKATRRRYPDPDIAQWQAELDEAGQ